MMTSSQAVALCDISVTNAQQRSEAIEVSREIAGSMILCALLIGAQSIAGSGGGAHVAFACGVASCAGLVFLFRAPLPANALLADIDERCHDRTTSRILSQVAGAALAAALMTRVGIASLPTQLGTTELVREGIAAGALTMLLVLTRHDGRALRLVALSVFFALAAFAGVKWFGNPALLIGAAIGGLTCLCDPIGPVLCVLVLGTFVALCLPDPDRTQLPEPLI